MGFLHFLRKDGSLIGGGYDGAADSLLLPHPQSGDKGADADSGGSQIVYLVNLSAGINLPGITQNIIYLIGGDRIQAAAKGIELNEIQILP